MTRTICPTPTCKFKVLGHHDLERKEGYLSGAVPSVLVPEKLSRCSCCWGRSGRCVNADAQSQWGAGRGAICILITCSGFYAAWPKASR